MTAWLALLACVEQARLDGPGDPVAARTYLDEDGLPVYTCSPPADDSYILTLPFHQSMAWMDSNNFNILIDALTWVQPLVGVDSKMYRWREDGTYFNYEVNAYMKLSAYGVDHPVGAQGEWAYTREEPFGDVLSTKLSGWLLWDDETRFYTWTYDFDGLDWWFNPSTYCLGRIRHQRVQGSYTYWPDPETPAAEYLVPFPVTLLFDLQATTPAQSSTQPAHPYVDTSIDGFLGVRDLGTFFWDYSDDLTAADLWTAEALPEEEDE